MLPLHEKNQITTTLFKAQTVHTLQQLNERREPIFLTHNGRVRAVLVGVTSYHSTRFYTPITPCCRSEQRLECQRILSFKFIITGVSAIATAIAVFFRRF